MLGLNREKYQRDVKAELERNKDDVIAFNLAFRTSMAQYSQLFSELAQKLGTVARCDTCADPWLHQKQLINNLQQLNNRYGFILERQLSIGNTNPDVTIAAQNQIAQKKDFEGHLLSLRANLRQDTSDDARFNVDLAKLNQSIRIATAIAPRHQHFQYLNLVRANYASEDVAKDHDPLYRAETISYLDTENEMIKRQFMAMEARLRLKRNEQTNDAKLIFQTKQAELQITNDYIDSVEHWTTIKSHAMSMEQEFGFVIIPRDVLEPHTTFETPPPTITRNETQYPKNESEAKKMIDGIFEYCQNGIQSCEEQKKRIDTLSVMENQLEKGEDNFVIETSRMLRESIRSNRANILQRARLTQLVLFEVTQWFENKETNPHKNENTFSSITKEETRSFFAHFANALEAECNRFSAVLIGVESSVDMLEKTNKLAQRRLSNTPIDADDGIMSAQIKKYQNAIQTSQQDELKYFEMLQIEQTQIKNLEATIGFNLLPSSFYNEPFYVNGDDSLDIIHDNVEYHAQLENVETERRKVTNQLDDYRQDHVYNLLHNSAVVEDMKPLLEPILRARTDLIENMGKLLRRMQELIQFLEKQPRPKLRYEDSQDDLITQYFIATVKTNNAHLDYYEEVAQWMILRQELDKDRVRWDDSTIEAHVKKILTQLQRIKGRKQSWDHFRSQQIQKYKTVQDAGEETGYDYVDLARPTEKAIQILDGSFDKSVFDSWMVQHRDSAMDDANRLRAVTNIEYDTTTYTDTAHKQAELRTAKTNFLQNLAPTLEFDLELNDTINNSYQELICKLHFVLGSEDFDTCVTLHCNEKNNDTPCEQLLKNNMLNTECKDLNKCRVALATCTDLEDCEQKIEQEIKPEARIERFCSSFKPLSTTMYQRCKELHCDSSTKSKQCASLSQNMKNAQLKAKQLESEFKELLTAIPELSYPQSRQLDIWSAAQKDDTLMPIFIQIQQDLKETKDQFTFANVGTLVNARHKTLVAMQSNGSLIFDDAIKEWHRWIREVVLLLKYHCKDDACLSKSNCKNNQCGDELKK